jgi:Spy/CpxP family protein refolding chaperone
MKMNVTVLGLAALLVGAPTAAWAQNKGDMQKGDMQGKGDMMKGNHNGAMAALKLTPDQKQKLETMKDAAMKQAEPLRKEMQTKMSEMKGLWLADKPDRDAIVRKQAEMDSTKQKLRTIWTDFHLQMHDVLTPEQRMKWADHFGSMMAKGHGMHGNGMGMCPCMDGNEPPNGNQ